MYAHCGFKILKIPNFYYNNGYNTREPAFAGLFVFFAY